MSNPRVYPAELIELVRDMNVSSCTRHTSLPPSLIGHKDVYDKLMSNSFDTEVTGPVQLTLRVTKSEEHPGVISYAIPGYGEPLTGILSTPSGLVEYSSLHKGSCVSHPSTDPNRYYSGMGRELEGTCDALRNVLLRIEDPVARNKALFRFDREAHLLTSRSMRHAALSPSLIYSNVRVMDSALALSLVHRQAGGFTQKNNVGLFVGVAPERSTNPKGERVVWFRVPSPVSQGQEVLLPFVANGSKLFSLVEGTTKKIESLNNKEAIRGLLNQLAARLSMTNVAYEGHIASFSDALTHTLVHFDEFWSIATEPAEEQLGGLHSALFKAALSGHPSAETFDPEGKHMSPLSELRARVEDRERQAKEQQQALLKRMPENMGDVRSAQFGDYDDTFGLYLVPGTSVHGEATCFLYAGTEYGFDTKTEEIVRLRPSPDGFASEGSSSVSVDIVTGQVHALTYSPLNAARELSKVRYTVPRWVSTEHTEEKDIDRVELAESVERLRKLSRFFNAYTTHSSLVRFSNMETGVQKVRNGTATLVVTPTHYDFGLPGLRDVSVAFVPDHEGQVQTLFVRKGSARHLDFPLPLSAHDLDSIVSRSNSSNGCDAALTRENYGKLISGIRHPMREAIQLLDASASELEDFRSRVSAENLSSILKGQLLKLEMLDDLLQESTKSVDKDVVAESTAATTATSAGVAEEATEATEDFFVEYLCSDPNEDINKKANTMTDPNKTATTTTTRIVNQLKVEGEEAAYRVAVRQLTKLLVEPISAAIAGPDASAETRNRIAEFLRSPMGMSFVQLAASAALSTSVKFAKVDNDVVTRIGKELRITAMAEGADAMAEVVMAPLRQVMSMYLVNMQLPEVSEPAQLPSPSPSASEAMGDTERDTTTI